MNERFDGIIYDESTNKVLLVCGDAGVLISLSPDVDPKTGSADPAIDLDGKPEFLAADGRGKVFVNLENKDQVAVVDIKTGKVLNRWTTAPGGSPVGMAIDRDRRDLFIGCRKPQKLIVMDGDSWKIDADLPIGRGVDAVAFDSGYALASCGDGTMTVVGESSPSQFQVVETLTTRAGARTEGLKPEDAHRVPADRRNGAVHWPGPGAPQAGLIHGSEGESRQVAVRSVTGTALGRGQNHRATRWRYD